jgi:hypothetical protein
MVEHAQLTFRAYSTPSVDDGGARHYILPPPAGDRSYWPWRDDDCDEDGGIDVARAPVGNNNVSLFSLCYSDC